MNYAHEPSLVPIPPAITTLGVNIASKASCTQSSLSQWSTSKIEANNVVNGIRNGRFSFHTSNEDNPWLLLTFNYPEMFDEVLVFNRLDLPDRARRLCVDISIDGHGWHRIYEGSDDNGNFGGIDGHPLRIQCPGYLAKFIRFHLPGYTSLQLDSVEIYKH